MFSKVKIQKTNCHVWQHMAYIPQRICVMGRKKISTTIYITDEQDEGLKELSRRTKVPVSVYIREGIDAVLNKYRDVLPGQLPLIPKK